METKQLLTHLIVAAALAATGNATALAQPGPGRHTVSTEEQPRGVLLEEFTGINCGYCPQGHAIAEKLATACDRVYVVAVHGGMFATPAPDEPDFRTDEGSQLISEFEIERNGYPSGMVNRHDFYGSGSPVCSRTSWKLFTKAATAEAAPVNLYASASFDGQSRKLDIHVEGFFVADNQPADQELNVVWTQDDIPGPQNGGLMGDEYPHRHVLRDYVTPIWGDTLASPQQGQYFERDYTLTLPEDINGVEVKAEDIKVVAFVTCGKGDVANVTGCRPQYANYSKPLAARLSEPRIPIGNYWGCNFFEATVKNLSDRELTEATFDIDVNGSVATVAWNGSIEPFGQQEIKLSRQYDTADNGQNSYSITLKTLNGESVEPSQLSGRFASPRQAMPSVTVELKTNNEAGENTFCIKDANGNLVKEFGPYPDGQVTQTSESAELEAGKVYYFEVTDAWGDGIYSPAGYFTTRSADGSLIEQAYAIDDFGTRSVFVTSKAASGIHGAVDKAADGEAIAYRTDGTVAYKGPKSSMKLPTGTYIIYDCASRTATKVTANNNN